jgi:polyribonucleotide nucleotidyltransferase
MKSTASAEIPVGDSKLIIETGLMARLAGGAVTVRQGDTIVFSAVTAATQPREGIDYFPLQVEYREKFSAAGRFPGGFFKREARPSEKEVLTARFTDRPIRALFPDGYRNEVQVNNMLISADGEHDADILSIVAASAALVLSDIPFFGPVGAVRIGRVDGRFVVNPTNAERERSNLDLIYACTRDLPIMIEGSAEEASEQDLLAAMRAAHAECVKIIDAQTDMRRTLNLPEKVVADFPQDETLLSAARALSHAEMSEAMLTPGETARRQKTAALEAALKQKLGEQFPDMAAEQFRSAFDALQIEVVRKNVLERGKRVDGRGFDDVRPLAGMVGLLPRVHGSALFSRGETQALGTVTLGTSTDSQGLDAVTGGPDEKRFMLHYNMPPYSVGEVGRLGSTGRREIGHGALAERSLLPVIPEEYPYTVRLVSDIMSSNGSTSMASVCAGSLALMDAGVPIRKAVAGISVGLFTDAARAELVVDIVGKEDHCGDMDFKVAGTRDGITGFQLDLKIRGLDWELMARALEKARQARMHILDAMDRVIAQPRPDLSQYAPRIQELKIPTDKIGELIGPGGKNIRRITDITGTQIDIEDDGTVRIFSTNKKGMEMAEREISLLTADAKEGVIYNGTVTGITKFGAFVEILPGKDGLVHISELADFRVRSVEEVCKVGDQMWVKCIGIDEKGRVKLSRRAAMAERDKAGPA